MTKTSGNALAELHEADAEREETERECDVDEIHHRKTPSDGANSTFRDVRKTSKWRGAPIVLTFC
jgi:hypothetical protein